MGSKRSKRSRRDKRNSQRVPSTDAVTVAVAMKLEQCDIAEAVTVDEPDTVIDGLVLVDPVVITPARASCIPVLCRTPGSIVGSGRSYTSIRRVSEELSPTALKPSRIPRWAAASVCGSDSSISNPRSAFSASSSPAAHSVAVTPADQTMLSYDEDYGARTSSMSSLSSVEDLDNYTTEPAAVHVSLENKQHGIKMELDIEMAMHTPSEGGCLILAGITVPE